MYAVFCSGGKQYRVAPGDIIQLEKLEGESGAKLRFDNVLFAAEQTDADSKIWLGKPTLDKACVEGEVVGQGRGDKIVIVKMKRRKQYRRTKGHRQSYTQILVTSVDNGAGQTQTLSAADRKAKLSKFQSHLYLAKKPEAASKAAQA